MPAGLSVVSDTGGGGYDAVAGIWTVGALASGSSATLQVVGRFTSPSVVTVTAQVSASSLGDPDSTPDNNAPAEDDHATVVLTPSIADLVARPRGQHHQSGGQLQRHLLDHHDQRRAR